MQTGAFRGFGFHRFVGIKGSQVAYRYIHSNQRDLLLLFMPDFLKTLPPFCGGLIKFPHLFTATFLTAFLVIPVIFPVCFLLAFSVKYDQFFPFYAVLFICTLISCIEVSYLKPGAMDCIVCDQILCFILPVNLDIRTCWYCKCNGEWKHDVFFFKFGIAVLILTTLFVRMHPQDAGFE